MIVNKYGNGGGGVTPEQVEQEIQSALTPYWESGETKDYVDEAVSGIDLSNYWTSAETEDAISAATAGKADAVNVIARKINWIPGWNSQGIITGGTQIYTGNISVNGRLTTVYQYQSATLPPFYAPLSAGTAGDILVSTGSGAPVWSAVTMSDTEEIELPIAAAVNKLKGDFEARLDQQYYKKQETNNLLKDKVTARQVDVQIKNYADPLFQAVYETIEDKELPVSAAINELNEAINLIDEVVPAALVDLNERKVGSDSVHTIWSGSQTAYDAITIKDPNTLYIIK